MSYKVLYRIDSTECSRGVKSNFFPLDLEHFVIYKFKFAECLRTKWNTNYEKSNKSLKYFEKYIENKSNNWKVQSGQTIQLRLLFSLAGVYM